jgi:hypothetical protein
LHRWHCAGDAKLHRDSIEPKDDAEATDSYKRTGRSWSSISDRTVSAFTNGRNAYLIQYWFK